LVVAKIRERLAVSKRHVNKMDMDRFNPKKLNKGEIKEQYQLTIKNRFSALESLEAVVNTVMNLPVLAPRSELVSSGKNL
jgi:hypothetical protein